MNELIERVSFEMHRYQLEKSTEETFFIVDGYLDTIVRSGLTANDEPMDLCDEMNARAAIEAMREPTEAMVEACDRFRVGIHLETRDAWTVMIDEALK